MFEPRSARHCGTYVNDRPTAALFQMRERGLNHVERAFHQLVKFSLKFIPGGVFEKFRFIGLVRVVDYQVDPAESFRSARYERIYLRCVADIRLHAKYLCPTGQ